jgi:hypothetical protein
MLTDQAKDGALSKATSDFCPVLAKLPQANTVRFRRPALDFERYATTVAASIHLAMIRIMLKRLAANPSS